MCFVPGDDRHVKINGGTPGGRQAALGRRGAAGDSRRDNGTHFFLPLHQIVSIECHVKSGRSSAISNCKMPLEAGLFSQKRSIMQKK